MIWNMNFCSNGNCATVESDWPMAGPLIIHFEKTTVHNGSEDQTILSKHADEAEFLSQEPRNCGLRPTSLFSVWVELWIL